MSDIQTKPDPLEPLVRRYLLSGDEEAMDRLVERTRPRLLAVARRIGAPQDAEDAVQGAYMALVRKRGSDLEAPVLPWLLTTVIRLAYRRKAKHQRQRDLATRLARPGETQAPDRRALAAERETLVRAAVARLPANYRDAVVLRHLEGLSTRETAALLEITEPAVRTRLHRAGRLLQGRVPAVLLATLLFLPWCAADAVRRLGPLTRPLWGRPVPLAALGGGLLIGAFALFGGFAGAPEGAAARPPHAAPDEAEAGARPPPQPEPERNPKGGEDEPARGDDEREGAQAPRPVPLRGERGKAETGDAPKDDGRDAERRPVDPRPETPRPGVIPIDVGAQPEIAPPPGMVLLEGGHVPIGTAPEDLARLLAGRPADHKALFRFETPRHRAFLRPYYIGRYEVTNAQYLRFLEDHRTQYTTGQGALDTLEAIAGYLVKQSRDEQLDARQVVWRQLYFANKGKIWRALGKRMDALFVWNEDRSVDEERTALALRTERLPTDIVLDFYSIRPPAHWPALKPPPGESDHPVRYVSYNEAERFAEWAGMHLPTEQEWEWAARGGEGGAFPWGDDWAQDEIRANWGGRVTNEHHDPMSVAVDSLDARPKKGLPPQAKGDGRSWCGLHHMCGNVAEWTSSWFQPYPGTREKHAYMGSWVKVIRGGSAASGSVLTLRAACRNFVGAGPDAPPYPENRFQWVGMRLAAWRQPGRDHVPPMLRRVARPRKVKRASLEPERFAGFVTRNWEKAGAKPKDHVYVRGRSRAVVFVPVASLLRDTGLQRMRAAWKRPSGFQSTRGLLNRSEEAPWVLGALHTDMPLVRMQVPVVEKAPGPKKKRRSTRGRAKAPRTEPGSVAPGTYVVGLYWRRLALFSPSLELVGFLPEPAADSKTQIPSVEVSLRTSKELGTPTLNPTLETGEGDLDFRIPLGGKGVSEQRTVHVRLALPFETGLLFTHAPWLRSR